MAKLSKQLEELFNEWQDNISTEIDRIETDNIAKVNKILALKNEIRDNEDELAMIEINVRDFAKKYLKLLITRIMRATMQHTLPIPWTKLRTILIKTRTRTKNLLPTATIAVRQFGTKMILCAAMKANIAAMNVAKRLRTKKMRIMRLRYKNCVDGGVMSPSILLLRSSLASRLLQ